MNKRRVVVTGLGMVTPLGNDVDETWRNIQNGVSGVSAIEHLDTTGFPVRIGGSIKGFDVGRYMSSKEARRADVFIHYGVVAAAQAIADAGLEINAENAESIGVAVGSGIGGITGIEKGAQQFFNGGARKISPFFVPANIINMIAGNISIKYGLKGPNLAVVTACSTGTHNIGHSARAIERGDADVMIAGGAEMATSPTGLNGFAAAKALSTRNDAPQAASRPWDQDRDGFVLSDGAGVMVLEEYQRARRRNASIYAELIGYAANADAYHITLPAPEGDGAAKCMRRALADAALNPEEIDYINAHGTSTPAGDVIETKAVKQVFGDHAGRLAISSTKSMLGHMLGAAGSVEAILSVLALRDGVAPPTINLDRPDRECDLDFVPHEARRMDMKIALSNSFGFGGTNGSLIFRKM